MLCAGAMRAIVLELAEDFREQGGAAVRLRAGTAGEVRHMAALEPADLVIATDVVVDALLREGVAAGERCDLARVGLGFAVRPGEPLPEIGNERALRRTLLAARTFAHPDPARGATAGVHVAALLQELGIADAVAQRVRLCASGAAMCEALARGEAELGSTQVSEILADSRVLLVGAPPSALQRHTVYSAALGARARAPAAARALLSRLVDPAEHARFAAAGFVGRA